MNFKWNKWNEILTDNSKKVLYGVEIKWKVHGTKKEIIDFSNFPHMNFPHCERKFYGLGCAVNFEMDLEISLYWDVLFNENTWYFVKIEPGKLQILLV